MKVHELDETDCPDFEDLLVAAEHNASTDWAIEFVGDMRERYETYYEDMFISPAQLGKLKEIAYDE